MFDQQVAKELKASYERLILVCGHYEGVDQRFIDECVDEEISMGGFRADRRRDTGHGAGGLPVPDGAGGVAGGELLHRRVPLGRSAGVPAVLTAGGVARPEGAGGVAIGTSWEGGRLAEKESYKRTMTRRPDLFARFDETSLTTKHDRKVLAEAKAEWAAEQESPAAE